MGTPTLIYCADGNPTFARIALEEGWAYGARLPSTVYAPLKFADQDWKRPCLEKYAAAIANHRPETATVLDWEHPEQWGEVQRWAEVIAPHVERLVVIPKVPGTIGEIPATLHGRPVVLGYSVPTAYGGTPVPVWEFSGRPVHLLGGSPQKQLELAGYLDVVSADGNMAHQQAHKGRTWRRQAGPKGHWWQLSDAGYGEVTEGANALAFRLSLREIGAAWCHEVR